MSEPPDWAIPPDLYAAMHGDATACERVLRALKAKVASRASLEEADGICLDWILESLCKEGGVLVLNKVGGQDSKLRRVAQQIALLDLISAKKKLAQTQHEKITTTEAMQSAVEEIAELGLSTGDYLPKFLRKAERKWKLATTVAYCIEEDDDFWEREQRAYGLAAERLSKEKKPPSPDDCREAYQDMKEYVINHRSSAANELPEEA